MRAIILRLDAPMMSFGTVLVDHHGVIDRFPGTAMLCGMLANALGWYHGDFERLQGLQSRIRYAARWDVKPRRMVDYHTVDLGQEKMREQGWTTRGVPEHRQGGSGAKFGTHQRYRHYWTDGLMTVALELLGDDKPDLDTVASALQQPARPLFLGRKTCSPARPLLDPLSPVIKGQDLLKILSQVQFWDRYGEPTQPTDPAEACWPAELGTSTRGEIRQVYDLRDWTNQITTGGRLRAEGLLGVQCP